MYVASYEVDGRGTHLRAPDAATLRTMLAAPVFRADGDAVHVALMDAARPLAPATGIHTTLRAVREWTSGPLPSEVPGTTLDAREAALGMRDAFLREVRRLFEDATRSGILDLAQAAAIVRAATLAVGGIGPAGRRGTAQAHAVLARSVRG